MKLKTLKILVPAILIMNNCGDSPEGPPAIEYGDLSVEGYFNNSLTDSISLTLDDEFLGTFDNPHVVTDIEAGTHKVFASFGDLIGETELVSIEQNKMTHVSVELAGTGPYTGYTAPDFELKDLTDSDFRLSDHAGKVILLFFFEHT